MDRRKFIQIMGVGAAAAIPAGAGLALGRLRIRPTNLP